jgi:transposase
MLLLAYKPLVWTTASTSMGTSSSAKPCVVDRCQCLFANLPHCLVGMEGSNGAHYWASVLTDLGHKVRLISPQFVAPYVKSNKNDRNDAGAICEAVG